LSAALSPLVMIRPVIGGRSQSERGQLPAPWLVRNLSIHVDIHCIHASLGAGMASITEPCALSQADVGKFGNPEAAPVTTRLKTAGGFSGELEGEQRFFAAMVAQDIGAKLAPPPPVIADHLLAIENCAVKKTEGVAECPASDHNLALY
jgi:hypothetical protein